MNKPICYPLDFLMQFRAATQDKSFAPIPKERACVITRSPAKYGHSDSTMIEWEGTPPKFSIYYGNGVLLVRGKLVKEAHFYEASSLIERFLKAHPANEDDTPVWIGTRWRARP
ncbi:MAG: hypothetical protein Q7J75_02025 [Rhodoferax sp.]|nr:hypothetical protein [Rhodoferax sp.]